VGHAQDTDALCHITVMSALNASLCTNTALLREPKQAKTLKGYYFSFIA